MREMSFVALSGINIFQPSLIALQHAALLPCDVDQMPRKFIKMHSPLY